jgi:predicted nuclease of predicted toxin-antitoxin system
MDMSPLRFLADEGCDFGVVRALRAAGYDVFAVCEVMTRSDDHQLIQQAGVERRILLTEDKDFGWLVFVSHVDSSGVILIRFPGNARQSLAQAVLQVVQEQREDLLGAFVVIQPGYVRIGHKPGAQS